jgi:hypothetical protein
MQYRNQTMAEAVVSCPCNKFQPKDQGKWSHQLKNILLTYLEHESVHFIADVEVA